MYMPACVRMMLMLPSHEFSTIMPCTRQIARQSPMSTVPFYVRACLAGLDPASDFHRAFAAAGAAEEEEILESCVKKTKS